MLANSPIWRRILSFFSKGQFPVQHWLTSITQWHSNGDHSSKLRCEQATAPKPPEIGSLTKLLSLIPSTNITANRHHWPQKNNQVNPIYQVPSSKITKMLSLGWHPIQRLSSRHAFLPCWASYKSPPMWSVLSVAIGNPNSVGPTKLISSQKSLKCSKHGEKGLGKNKNTKWPTPLIQILDQGGWMFSLRGTSCKLM